LLPDFQRAWCSHGKATSKLGAQDEILPIHDVQVQIRLDKKPAVVTQQPAGKKLPFTWSKGVCSLRVPQIDLHEILQITPS
jgi:hypothetical protein